MSKVKVEIQTAVGPIMYDPTQMWETLPNNILDIRSSVPTQSTPYNIDYIPLPRKNRH